MRTRTKKGLAAVEAAMLMPIILLLVFGMIEYGWMFLKAQQVHGAARAGARVAVRPSVAGTTWGTNAGVNLEVLNVLAAANLDGCQAGVPVTNPTDVTTAAAGDLVTVTVTVTYDGCAELTHIPFVPVPSVLKGSATMAKEGPFVP